jgi:hypothetical protein
VDAAKTGIKHPKMCKVCGDSTYAACTFLCYVPLHFALNQGSVTGKKCYFLWHDDTFFGLAKDNCGLLKERKSDWEYPSQAKQRENIKYIQELMKNTDKATK